jgi:hypothetical protein
MSSKARILQRFEWKNGTRLSDLKRISVLKNFVAHRSFDGFVGFGCQRVRRATLNGEH